MIAYRSIGNIIITLSILYNGDQRSIIDRQIDGVNLTNQMQKWHKHVLLSEKEKGWIKTRRVEGKEGMGKSSADEID